MNKVYMSFSSTCDLVRRKIVRLSDIRRAKCLIFNAAREYWDTDSFVPEEFLTFNEKTDLLKWCRSNGVSRTDVINKKNQIDKSHLPDECVVQWNLFLTAMLEVDRKDPVVSKDEFYDEGFIPKPEGYIGWASTLSKRGTFVFMGEKLWIPREGNFCSERGAIAHSSSTFLQLIHEGLSEEALSRKKEDMPEFYLKYADFSGCLGEGTIKDNFWTRSEELCSREQSEEVGHA